ncbi:MAG: hypothetical protein L0922_01440, partial [Candidatus Mariimomonas ferrooxydans]
MNADSVLKRNNNDLIRIALGDISFAVETADQQLIQEFKDNFILSSYETTSHPNLTMQIDYITTINSRLASEIRSYAEKGSDYWHNFQLGSGPVKGYYRWTDNHAHVVLDNGSNHLPASYIFSLLASAYYILRDKKLNGSAQNNFFLHAAGLKRNNNGYVFSGPSGSGKTTVSMLSLEDSIVINDECILFEKIDDAYWITNTPLRSPLHSKKAVKARVKSKFFLTKSDGHELIRMKGVEALMKIA